MLLKKKQPKKRDSKSEVILKKLSSKENFDCDSHIRCKLYIAQNVENTNEIVQSKRHDLKVRDGDFVIRVLNERADKIITEEKTQKFAVALGKLIANVFKYHCNQSKVKERCQQLYSSPQMVSQNFRLQPINFEFQPKYLNVESCPPRPPLPRPEDYFNKNLTNNFNHIRSVSLQRSQGSFGFRILGGNNFGAFVSSVLPFSTAYYQSVQKGDQILKINGKSLSGFTREKLKMLLDSLPKIIDIELKYNKDQFDKMMETKEFDRFYIKTNFDYDIAEKDHLAFKKGTIFRVIDTGDKVDQWLVHQIDKNNKKVHKGFIPSESNASKLVKQREAEKNKRVFNFGRFNQKHLNQLLTNSATDLLVYETVYFGRPNYKRPVILLSPLADWICQNLAKDFSKKFLIFKLQDNPQNLDQLQEALNSTKHLILEEINPNFINFQLISKNFYPIVIFIKILSKDIIKDFKKSSQKTKNLLKRSQKLEEDFKDIFTKKIQLDDENKTNFTKILYQTVKKCQNEPIWMMEQTLLDENKRRRKTNENIYENIATKRNTTAKHQLRQAHDDDGGGDELCGSSCKQSPTTANVKWESPPSLGSSPQYDHFIYANNTFNPNHSNDNNASIQRGEHHRRSIWKPNENVKGTDPISNFNNNCTVARSNLTINEEYLGDI